MQHRKVTGKFVRGLLGLLKSRFLGYALDSVALLLLVALVARFSLGYIPHFFFVSLLIALLLFAVATAIFIVQRSGKSTFDFLLATVAAVAIAVPAVALVGVLPLNPIQAYRERMAARPDVFVDSLPGDLGLFLDGFDKSKLNSLSGLARWADYYYQRWRLNLLRQGFTDSEAKAVSMMLFASSLWAFGNKNYPQKVGCISTNEDNGWKHQEATLEVVKSARIGCCTDFAFALSLILSKNGFENRYAEIPGHVFNEAKIDGKWYVLDANTNIFVNAAWNTVHGAAENVKIHVFPHPGTASGKLHRRVEASFQDYMVNLLLFGDIGDAVIKKGRSPDPKYARHVDDLYSE